jgi:hypothetical protein
MLYNYILIFQMTLNIIKLSGIEYYLSVELCKYDPAYFGNIKRRNDILKKIKFNPTDYIYAYEKDNKWIVSY